jgi:uncharacterized protein (DUF1501 family)
MVITNRGIPFAFPVAEITIKVLINKNKEIAMLSNHEVNRREFIRQGAIGAAATGLSAGGSVALGGKTNAKNCIFVFLTGGPSQLETFDPKPDAPAEIRGPFRAISTAVPGLAFSELLPGLAARANDLSVIRSIFHDQAPIHESGQQLVQTGSLACEGREYPHLGAMVSATFGRREPNMPAFVMLPTALGSTGVNMYQGQGVGHLGQEHLPATLQLDKTFWGGHPSVASSLNRKASNSSFGMNAFGRSCQAAVDLVEAGTRFVCLNMFETVFNSLSWDCHADGGSLATNLKEYRTSICPMFDMGMSTMLDELKLRGMLESTLVVAVGEFGRSPVMNVRGGRDHHSGVWSGILAGAGLPGGAVIGSSDAMGSEPAERPVHASSLHATIAKAIGIAPQSHMPAISELF